MRIMKSSDAIGLGELIFNFAFIIITGPSAYVLMDSKEFIVKCIMMKY